MQCRPLDVFITKEHGGKGGNVGECLKMLETSSYESLPLSLMMGINGALFIQPVTRYGEKQVAEEVLKKFVHDQAMGGLMITEPGYGSDALHMQTSYTEHPESFSIKGVKHWAGLTGWADFWLLTARKRNKDGSLARDIDFFIHDTRNPGIEVEEYYENLGLYILPYGRNRIDVNVPSDYKLKSDTTGIKLMLDMLHRSRMQFPGMAMGFLRRIADDALEHVKNRHVGGKCLLTYDQVKQRIVKLQSWLTSCSAMCSYTSQHAPITSNLYSEDVPANAIKSIVTDMMQDASQSYLQLAGAQGYRLDHMAGRGTIDSRPFQIFEGSNDILYQQIAESIVKKMKKAKISTLYDYLESYELTDKASGYLKKYIRFSVSGDLSQRKQVVFGKMLGYTIIMNMVLNLGEKGFNSDLVQNTVKVLTGEIKKFLMDFHEMPQTTPLEDLDRDTDWADFASF